MSQEQRVIAYEIKELFDEISLFIEEFTLIVCPDCEDACCKQKHSRYSLEDKAFVTALGYTEHRDDGRGPEETCEFLSHSGCAKPRWERPFICTNYFCNPLLNYMINASAKKYREMVRLLGEMVRLRNRLVAEK